MADMTNLQYSLALKFFAMIRDATTGGAEGVEGEY